MNPSVKVIILNWNGANLTIDCLKSFEKVQYNNYEVLVVDNGSIDDSIIKIKSKYPNIEILELDKNYGFSGGNNRAIDHIKNNSTDLVIFLNNDTTVEPDFIEKLVEQSKKMGDKHFYGPKMLYADSPTQIWYAGGIVDLDKGIIEHIGIREIDNRQFDSFSQTNYISGCCLMTSFETIIKLNGFNELFNMYAEDVDLCIRAKAQKINCYFVPESKIYHKVSASLGGQFSYKKIVKKMISIFKLVKVHRNILKAVWVIVLMIVRKLKVKRYEDD